MQDEQGPAAGTDAQVADNDIRQVSEWHKKIAHAKKHFYPVFKRMKDSQEFAYYNARKEWFMSGKYVVPFMRRQLKQIVSGLYARNPTATAERKRRIDTVAWNGDFMQLKQAFETMLAMQSGMPVDPTLAAMAQAIVQEAEATRGQYAMRDRFARTLEILFDHFIEQAEPTFKSQMKQTAYRTFVNGVAYVKLDFQRVMEPRPEITGKIGDDANAIAKFQQLASSKDETSMDAITAASMTEGLQQQKVLREGPVFAFPKSHKIIVDPAVVQLQGFVGAGWIATEIDLTCDAIKQFYGVDVKDHPTDEYTEKNASSLFESEYLEAQPRCVWEVEHKTTGTVFTICEGYKFFLRRPSPPRVKLERFWSVYPLMFDPVESETDVYPLSFVNMMIDTQNEYNVARQGLKAHRRANKPKYFMKTGSLNPTEKNRLQDHEENEVIEVQSMQQGQKPSDIVAPFEPYQIDPNQYSTAHVVEDAQLIAGLQGANTSTPKGVTATETTIAEESRETAESADSDTLDEYLSDLAKGMSEIMLGELSIETVKKIVGPGAVWPAMSDTDIYDGVDLKIQAGSSGRPNQAATLAKLERAMPFLQLLPNVSPEPIAKRYAESLDLDPEELIVEGLPSISAMNALAGKPTPATNDPRAQGPQGADNAPAGPTAEASAGNQFPARALAPGENSA